jgi:single-strand DNA-binding protein
MLNNIVLAGNVVKDPTTRSTPTGKNVSTLRLAVNNPLNDKEVLYIDIETWDKQAEFVGKHVKKGSSVSAVGRLRLDEWMKDGNKQSKYLVIADRVNFIGGKKKEDGVNTTSVNIVSNDAQSDDFDDAAFAVAAGIK